MECRIRIDGLILNVGRDFSKLRITMSFFYVRYPVVLSVIIIKTALHIIGTTFY
jgi:hypothetical protein